jgi:hypothetical protein
VLDIPACLPAGRDWGDEAAPGIRVTHFKHLYGDTGCRCGHQTRRLPQRAEKDAQWCVEISKWHLVGPGLMALMCVWR